MKNQKINKLSTFLYYISILTFIIAFNFAHNPPGGWYQQFMPNIGNRSISDIFFLDSLTGWAVTPYIDLDDTAYVLKTNDGGDNWEIKYTRTGAVGYSNPNHIYFKNKDFGFMSNSITGSNPLYRTTNSGVNWTQIPGGPFTDIYFIDSLTGWKSLQSSTVIKKTTNGGLNWSDQPMPQGGNIISSAIYRFSNVNKNTIWAVGGYAFVSSSSTTIRGIIYRTTSAGENWSYQIPDTNIQIGRYNYCKFINNYIGWAYRISPTGIHTKVGGDSTFTNIKNPNTQIADNFILYQNYPNPFNPNTIISYQLSMFNYVSMKVYDILGNEIKTLVNTKQGSGSYKVKFDGSGLPSGVYFYSLFIDGDRVDTKKMVLVR
ncbi:MAG: T9SS type A sorting domain-containing protein [Ignavibacteria bacterium]|nr:T9SS type A sorting domain-containing protein [Ignavibacteria bacterium]